MAKSDEVQTERLDKRRLAHARRSADADANRFHCVRQQRFEHRLPARLVFPPGRLDQRDRLRERAPFAGADPCHERVVGGCQRNGGGLRTHGDDGAAISHAAASPQRCPLW